MEKIRGIDKEFSCFFIIRKFKKNLYIFLDIDNKEKENRGRNKEKFDTRKQHKTFET